MALFHVVVGIGLVAAGLASLSTPKRRRSPHVLAGRVYMGLLCVTLGTGTLVGLRNPGLTLFEIATPPTLAMGLFGWWAVRAKPRRLGGLPWKAWHVVGVGGSFIGVVTATTFQVVPRFLDPVPQFVETAQWVLPTVVGTLLISRKVNAIAGVRRERVASRPGS